MDSIVILFQENLVIAFIVAALLILLLFRKPKLFLVAILVALLYRSTLSDFNFVLALFSTFHDYVITEDVMAGWTGIETATFGLTAENLKPHQSTSSNINDLEKSK